MSEIKITAACRDKHHKRCKGAKTASGAPGCSCTCHAPERKDVAAKAQELYDIDRAKAEAEGTAKRTRERCKNGHDLSPESNNLGPRGACRACKREANTRCLARRAERAAKAEEQVKTRGKKAAK